VVNLRAILSASKDDSIGSEVKTISLKFACCPLVLAFEISEAPYLI
jgi:hypothetical protein